jgi:hypothetical protein
LKKAPSKRSNSVMIAMPIGGNEAERHRIMRRPFQLAARKHAGGIAIDDQAEQEFGMVGRHDEARQVSLRQPLINRWRQLKAGPAVERTKVARASVVSPRACARLFLTSARNFRVALCPTGC